MHTSRIDADTYKVLIRAGLVTRPGFTVESICVELPNKRALFQTAVHTSVECPHQLLVSAATLLSPGVQVYDCALART